MNHMHLFKETLLIIAFFLITLLGHGQTIVATDFNREQPWFKDYRPEEKWNDLSASASHSTLVAKATWGKYGMIDVANTTIASDGLQLLVENTGSLKEWSATLHSGLLPAKNSETNLGKLTLSFDHSVASLRPIVLRIESFGPNKKRTGGLETRVYPATSRHFLRAAFELSSMQTFGDGKFNPKDPFVQVSFTIAGLPRDEVSSTKYELQIDNFSYRTPAYYVSPAGKDGNDGRTENTAFASPQAALNLAQPGDIILLMNGNYKADDKTQLSAVANFVRAGSPSAWITLKNYPGHQPVILCQGKDGVRIAQGTARTATLAPVLAYLEVRGLHFKGNSAELLKQNSPELGTSTPATETTGVYIDGSFSPVRMYHHIRVADCIAEYCGADGIYGDYTDWLTLENNILRYNCFTSVHWAMSGFSLMHYADFDKVDNVTKILVRGNQAYGNQCKVYKKTGPHKIYNGNGMLFDANCEEYLHPDAYLGCTLVQSNLVYGNGGGGIQMWGSYRIDVVNNTLYHNGITPELKWGNLGFDYCKDIRVINNIVVAQPDRPLDFWIIGKADRKTANIERINNLYFGGIQPNLPGTNDLVADPLFENPSLDPQLANFRLKAGSPATNAGNTAAESLPLIDVLGKPVPLQKIGTTCGAYTTQR